MFWVDKFNPLDGVVVLRLICGLFFLPHVIGKFAGSASIEFFKAAKFKPPAMWMYLAATIEAMLSICLVFALYTPFVALVTAFHLLVAAVAMYELNRKWIWLIGGIEFCIFWMLSCVALSLLTWP
jgi:putative oxidoreductase